MTQRRKRLIEVAFPLEEVSAHSRREKNTRHGHISTLHIWWARRPLAACRGFIYASLVDDPDTDAERDALLREVADLASWDAVRHPDRVVRNTEDGGSGLTGTELLKRARERILARNDGKPPRLLDPFAGGGAIPLEGLRLGCEVEASDLNPVAVLILKATLEYPQKFGRPNSREVPEYILQADRGDAQTALNEGQGSESYLANPLAADVRYWGQRIMERAREELAEFYPPDPDGSVPVAYLWSRTIPCPSCEAEMPLIRQYWLARKDKKKVALDPVVDHEAGTVDFRVVEGEDVTGRPEQATTSRGDTRCLLCGQIVKAAQIRQLGRAGRMGARMTSVVLAPNGRGGKRYRAADERDLTSYSPATARMNRLRDADHGEQPLVPEEPMPRHLTGGVITAFGFDQWDKLFNDRQLAALTTFARLIEASQTEILQCGVGPEHAAAITTSLGLALSRYVDFCCTIARWKVDAEAVVGAMARQALPMVWDYVEHAATTTAGGSFLAMVDRVAGAIEVATVSQRGARACSH